MVLASGRLKLLSFVKRYGREHASPNSGYPESAMAGILDCRFGGPNIYHGILVEKPYIGTNDRELSIRDYKRAARINQTVCLSTVILICLAFTPLI